MKKFQFSLQTVHSVRETKRDKEEHELVRLRAAVTDANERVLRIENERAQVANDYSKKLNSGTIDPFEAAMTSNYLTALVHREREAREKLKQAETAVERQRQMLTEAERDVEATSRLREKQRERHALDVARVEQNQLDEMATVASARKMANEK